MNENLKSALNKIGADYIKEIATNLIRAGKDSSGELIDSLSYEVVDTVNQITVEIIAKNYLQYVDQGRKKGIMPPVKAIIPWVKKNNIRIGKTPEESAFVIAKSIEKNGIKPTNVLKQTKATLLQNIYQLIEISASKDVEKLVEDTFKEFK